MFDPNLRENLWENLDDAKACIQKALNLADIVKVSEEELYFLTDHAGLLDGGRMLLERYGLKALLITMGAAGCCAVLPEYSLTVPWIPRKGGGHHRRRGLFHGRISL